LPYDKPCFVTGAPWLAAPAAPLADVHNIEDPIVINHKTVHGSPERPLNVVNKTSKVTLMVDKILGPFSIKAINSQSRSPYLRKPARPPCRRSWTSLAL